MSRPLVPVHGPGSGSFSRPLSLPHLPTTSPFHSSLHSSFHSPCLPTQCQVVGGLSERGGFPVVRMPLRQWLLQITSYADQLADDLDSEDLSWPDGTVSMQKSWIGRSVGATIAFELDGGGRRNLSSPAPPHSTYPLPSCAVWVVLAPSIPLPQTKEPSQPVPTQPISTQPSLPSLPTIPPLPTLAPSLRLPRTLPAAPRQLPPTASS